MKNLKSNETRHHYSEVESTINKPTYENLEDELINVYPKVDLLNLHLEELKRTISEMCEASEIKGERDYKRAFDELNEKLKIAKLTRLSVIALEAAQSVATLGKDSQKAVLLEHAVASVKMVNAHTQKIL